MKIEPKIKNEKRLLQLDFLYNELKKQNEIYKNLKKSTNNIYNNINNPNEDMIIKELKLTKQKILAVIFKIRRILKEFELSENPC